MTIPDGFTPHERKSPLTDPWEPLYSKRSEVGIVIGLRAAEAHCNSRGFVHGGLISALADNAMGLSCGVNRTDGGRLVTISLNVDFVRAARIGQWLEFTPLFIKNGRHVDLAQGQVTADGAPCALVAATFQVSAGV